MTSLLQRIVDLFVCWVQTGATLAFNAIIAGLGAVWSGVVALLPDMPAAPDLPASVNTGFAWANWAFPLSWLVAYFVQFLVLVVAVMAVMTLLRWLRVVE